MVSPLVVSAALLVLGGLLLSAESVVAYRRSHGRLSRRIDQIAGRSAGPVSPATAGLVIEDLASSPVIWLRRAFGIGKAAPWQDNPSLGRLAGLGLVAAAVTIFITVWLLKLSLLVACAAGIAVLVATARAMVRRRQRRSTERFLDLFPEAIDMLVRMIRAGMPITAAIDKAAAEVPAPVGPAFRYIADQMSIGIPLEEIFGHMVREIRLAEFRFLAVAITLQRGTGGNLAITLETMTDIIRKRKAVRLKARAASSEVRLSAVILSALPVVIGAGMLAFSPAYLQPLFTDSRGRILLGLAAMLIFVGSTTMRSMLRRSLKY